MVTYEQLLDRDIDWALREGSMHFEGTSAAHKTLRNIVQRLDELNVDYAIAGGMALFLASRRLPAICFANFSSNSLLRRVRGNLFIDTIVQLMALQRRVDAAYSQPVQEAQEARNEEY